MPSPEDIKTTVRWASGTPPRLYEKQTKNLGYEIYENGVWTAISVAKVRELAGEGLTSWNPAGSQGATHVRSYR